MKFRFSLLAAITFVLAGPAFAQHTVEPRGGAEEPAAVIGPGVRASLRSAIRRELEPEWHAPWWGPDAEKLVTILSWNLNRDGSLDGSPRVVRQEGITEANRDEAALHADRAIRAVRRAAPFQLPDEYYDIWKQVMFRFDERPPQ